MEVKKKESRMGRATDWLVGNGPLKESVRIAAEVTATSACALGAAAIFIGIKRGDHLATYEILGVVALTYFTMLGVTVIITEFKNDIVAFANKQINRIKSHEPTSLRTWEKATIAVVDAGAHILHKFNQRSQSGS